MQRLIRTTFGEARMGGQRPGRICQLRPEVRSLYRVIGPVPAA